ncbi:hypothetical protein L1049_021288 [Liquidambar formosana]|uniref:Late embryogenesis abundant protein LEA-2 subgroup domain-containing protein n=1 Tax=Liquidambar formosana TaxID=63359 RepID=A0AAP0SEB5_LIQFO
MARNEQSTSPLAPANRYARSDTESATTLSKELRRKRNMKRLAYFAAFAVFQTIVILVFSLTVMRIKSPKFRVQSARIENLTTINGALSMTFYAQVGVKNTNFGHFKYENSTIAFAYRGIPVGEATVVKARAKARSTKKIDVIADLASSILSSNSEFASDISVGILPLTSQSRLNGKVHLMKIMKKKKSTQMNCTMEVNIVAQTIQNLKCK